MSDTMLVRLTVNGEPRTAAVEPSTTLLTVLRNHFGLTGTKRACGTGDCGACTVLLDGDPVNACLVLAASVDGKDVMTVEGLAPGGDLHPLQQSFVKHGALQCGFCTSGMLMAAKGLLDHHPHPDRDEITEALSGNLCPCAAYPRILRAVEAAHEFEGRQLDTEPHDSAERDQERDHATNTLLIQHCSGEPKNYLVDFIIFFLLN